MQQESSAQDCADYCLEGPQVRLCARYRRLMAAGKRQSLITTAIAREMAAFLWAIGHEVQPHRAVA